ncbi:arsenate reductase (glutaredoxin) [Maritimibacter sp. 55A14]|nr:arsenate reductase (glutaredoxin) [Maritimibacter sp. 55A14]
MTPVTIWHNPRCSKSRQTLELLETREVAIDVRLYLKQPPSAAEIRAAMTLLGVPAVGMMRIKDKLFTDLGLSEDADEDDLIAAMVAHPILIERPIVFANGKAALGRPPEAVLPIL